MRNTSRRNGKHLSSSRKTLSVIFHETVAGMMICKMKRRFTSVQVKQAVLPDNIMKAEFWHLSA